MFLFFVIRSIGWGEGIVEDSDVWVLSSLKNRTSLPTVFRLSMGLEGEMIDERCVINITEAGSANTKLKVDNL